MKKLVIFLALTIFPIVQLSAQNTATDILGKAYTQAKKDNKNVFVIFHASWCGWCKKMEANLANPEIKGSLDKEYVFSFLDVLETTNKSLETPGADKFLELYKGTDQGLPFWVILDYKGNVLTNSLDTNESNLGSPASADEVTIFIDKLRNTSSLTEDELKNIASVFTLKK